MYATVRKHYGKVGAALLLLFFLCELTLSIRQQSVSYDESYHLFAGYMFWEKSNRGIDAEHPPLAKALAALPLLSMHPKLPSVPRYAPYFSYLDARDFVFGNGGAAGADRMLFRARLAAASLSLLLGLLVFLAAQEMFGTGAALFALALLVFEPNIVAHGAYVTTDMGAACFIFASIYALYRFIKVPCWTRMITLGIACGLALASKNSALLILPMAVALFITELLWAQPAAQGRSRTRVVAGLLCASLLAVVVLWGCYGFRYSATPYGLVQQLNRTDSGLLLALSHWHMLPEAYLSGLAGTQQITSGGTPTYLLGKIYAHSVWFYFPVAFVIKSTAAFLLLILLSGFAVATGRLRARREILFLTIPPALYMLIAMCTGLNIGARHLLPIYPFLAVLIGGASLSLANTKRQWAYIAGVLLLWHIVSASRTAPDYLAYSNEFWGGPANTYRYLSDSNTDWAQQLKGVKSYLDERNIKDCWFAYFAEPATQFRRYGIPCKPLPTINIGGMEVPPTIHGTILISASTLSGFEYGSNILNPYRSFQQLRPTSVIQHGVFVYDGTFDTRFISALGHANRATALAASNQLGPALEEAQLAVQTEPDELQAQVILGDIEVALGNLQEAKRAYQHAIAIAGTMEPDVSGEWVAEIQRKMPRL